MRTLPAAGLPPYSRPTALGGIRAVACSTLFGAASALAGPGSPVPAVAVFQLAREQDTQTPGAAFRLDASVSGGGLERARGVQLLLGDGRVVPMTFEPGDGEWAAHVDFSSFESLRTAVHGVWTVIVLGASPSVSTFGVDGDSLHDGDFFTCPQVVYPTEGDASVPANAEFSWIAPSDGPLPAQFVNPYVDYLPSPPGPAALVPPDTTAWDPPGCLNGGAARFGLAYLVPMPAALVTPFTVVEGAIEWSTSEFAPPGYPAGAPLFALGAETRRYFAVDGVAAADLDCNGLVNGADLGLLIGNWGGEGVGDVNADGIVNGADLGVLIGSWSP